jgi:arylsulfatase A-like enzyme
VLVITIDTLRADHLGCYGFPFAHTPATDKLAGESVRFAGKSGIPSERVCSTV